MPKRAAVAEAPRDAPEHAREEGRGLATDFSRTMSYGGYLQLETLLSAQQPLSDKHDELLFIIIHHVQELWMKLIIRELEVATDCVRADDLRPAFKGMARVSRIQRQLVEAWDVLSTMTPADYLSFREVLGQSSGFQSWQYRLMEILLGARDEFMLKPHAHDAALTARLRAAFDAPSLYQESLRLLARRGISVPEAVLWRDPSKPHAEDEGVVAAWEQVYRHSQEHFDLYELAEELVDMEDAFQQWRFRHVTTVERVIGARMGTGGSAGVAYLRRALERRFFPELWTVRGRL
ncbi:tryptophan 2,3-dioxygenase [Roseomonas rosea]|uniref:Tryptophan 2,3-dioxygenase n=1 Tax=Muricoccus roseus TaxID=198092 RepID=A0A1M6ANN4_9PROT|nr:tryptophan 2,3-dioxygenase [Roseomonas rosea]SHI38041.1 tryptophan 2,3-dioxygenase [Roseomonas rosea]